jgi:hypothetical protein
MPRSSQGRTNGEEGGYHDKKSFAELQQEQIKRDKNPQRKFARSPRPTVVPGGGAFARRQSDKIGGKGKGKDRD